jgi:prephenate dehydrogenase
MINRLAIIGLGMIGGSLALALRKAGQVREVVGYGRNINNLQDATRSGVIDHAAVTVADAVRNADMVVMASPVGAISALLAEVATALADHAVVTDVGSVKGTVVTAARNTLGKRFQDFVPGHPIAGTEHSGVAAAEASLFQGHRIILTPEPETGAAAVARVRSLWVAVGAEVVTMATDVHDRVLAAGSHLPHVLAYCLVDMLVRRDDHREIFQCAAGGFRDFTRIAGSDPVMWRDICLANRKALVEALGQYAVDLNALTQAIEQGKVDALLEIFTRAKHARDSWHKQNQN